MSAKKKAGAKPGYRKSYPEFTKEQEQSGFAKTFRKSKAGQDLIKQGNDYFKSNNQSGGGVFPKFASRKNVRAAWNKAAKSVNLGKFARKNGMTAVEASKALKNSNGAIPFKADPYRK